MTSLFRLWWIAKDINFPIGTSTHSRADKRKLATQMLSDLAPKDCRVLRTLVEASAYDESRLGAIQGLLRLPDDCDIRLAVPVLFDFAFSESYFSIVVAWALFYRGVLNGSQKEKIWQVIVRDEEERLSKYMASDDQEGRALAEKWRELKELANELRRGSISCPKLNELGESVARDEPLKAVVYFLAADSLNPGDRLALSNLEWVKNRQEKRDKELMNAGYYGYNGIDRVRILCGFTTSNESHTSSDTTSYGIAKTTPNTLVLMRLRLSLLLDHFRSVTCSGCDKRIGLLSSVKHKIEVGRAKVYFCDDCHQELVSNDDRFGVIRAKRRATGVVNANQNALAAHSQCPNCGQSAASDLMFGADLTKELDEKDIVFSFAYSRKPRSGEQGRAVYCMRKGCPSCIRQIVPGVSPTWMKDTAKFEWVSGHRIPFC